MIKKTTNTLSTLCLGTATLFMASTASAINFQVNETGVDVYGYVKLDAIYDVDANLNNAISRSNIRMDGEPGVDGHTTLSAIESRLGVTTTTVIGGHQLKTNIEGDFYGNGGFTGGSGGGFRLRHAYGVWNGILAGQTWSNFGNVLSLAPTVDFNGPLAHGGARQAQLRYTTGNFSVSMEDPEEGGTTISQDTAQYRIPDVTARFQSAAGPVNFAVAGLARFLEYDAEGATVDNRNWTDDSAVAWGVMVETNAKLTEAITIRGSVTHGDGIGGYLYLSPAQAGFVDSEGNLKTIEATGGGVNVSIVAGPGSFNIGYGLVIADLDEAFAQGGIQETADERYTSTFVNYIWAPVGPITYGLEAGYHTAKQLNGEEGDAVRLHAMIKYGF